MADWNARLEGKSLVINGPGGLEIVIHDFDKQRTNRFEPTKSTKDDFIEIRWTLAYPLLCEKPHPEKPLEIAPGLKLVPQGYLWLSSNVGPNGREDWLRIDGVVSWPIPEKFSDKLKDILSGGPNTYS